MAAETPYADAAAKGAEASSGLPQLDYSTWAGQIFWLVVTFAVLYFVLSKFILPRLSMGLEERSDHIADDLEAASRMQREAEEAEKAYTHALADARAKAHNVAETTRKAVDAEIQSELDAAEAETTRQAEIAEARIADLRKKALSNIQTIAEETTAEICETLIGKKPSAATLKSALKAV